jgi:outer membrane protein OmpA-like peptidoglycan-associated protein
MAFIFTAWSINTDAQPAEGRWVGFLQFEGDTAQHYFEIQMQCAHDSLRGVALLSPTPQHTITVSFVGKCHEKGISYQEIAVIKQRGRLQARVSSLKTATLSLLSGMECWVLQGTFEGRNGTVGSIYLTKQIEAVSNGIEVKIAIKDAQNQQFVPAWVEITRLPEQTLVLRHAVEGQWTTSLPKGEYEVFVDRRGFYHQHAQIGEADTALVFSLVTAKVGDVMRIEGLSFEQSEAWITRTSQRILNRLVRFLEENPHLEVRIAGHTDDVGSAYLNKRLSLERAESVVNYFISMGIAPQRLSAIGWGGTQPIFPNNSAENRAKNRRVTLEVLKK